MTKPIQYFKFLLPILLFSGIFACKEEIKIDNTDNGFPLNLRMSINDETPVFDWDAVNVSNFDGFTLVRSEQPILAGQKPENGGSTVLMKTNIADSLHFEDNNTPFTGELYYKLYVELGGRFIESQSVMVKQELTKLPFSADLLHFIPDSNWVVILTANQAKLTLYNYKEKKILGTKTIASTGFIVNVGDISMTDAVENGKRMLFYFSPIDKLYKFELKDFVQIKTTAVNTTSFSMVSNAGQLYSTHNDLAKSFSVRNASDLVTTKNTQRSNYFDRRLLVVLDGMTNKIGEISPTGISSFNINPATSQASNTTNVNFQSFGNSQMQHVPISLDKKYFIPKSDGQVFDNTLGVITQPLFLNSAIDFAFSLDGKYLYALSFDFSFQGALISKFNFPEMTLVGEKLLSSVSPRRIYAMEDGVMFFGIDFTQVNTFIKKIKL
jgi:hypothetical protein